ncbi:MAG: Ig-like domain-containing protein [Bacteroidales bacterium]|nr:Ig-like domain-containing protein [Bacteroidales bacterium]
MKPKIYSLRNVAIVVLLLIAVLDSCKKEDDVYSLNDPDGVKLNSIIYFSSLSATSIEADGVSQSLVTIQINPEADLDSRQIILSATMGDFSNGRSTDTITANASGMATFALTSIKTGRSEIRAAVKSYTVDTTVLFQLSLPQDILLTADLYILDATQYVKVTTVLSRDPFKGKISDPVKVFYSVIPDNPQLESLICPAFDYSDQGKSTITVSNPFLLTGGFKIKATTMSASGDSLSQSIYIKIL